MNTTTAPRQAHVTYTNTRIFVTIYSTTGTTKIRSFTCTNENTMWNRLATWNAEIVATHTA